MVSKPSDSNRAIVLRTIGDENAKFVHVTLVYAVVLSTTSKLSIRIFPLCIVYLFIKGPLAPTAKKFFHWNKNAFVVVFVEWCQYS